MFRIARVRIRWINTNQHKTNVVLPTQPAQVLRVRVMWKGFGPMDGGFSNASKSTRMVERAIIPSSGRVLGTFDLPRTRLRVIWLGLGSLNRGSVWMLGLLAILFGLFAFTRLAQRNNTNDVSDIEKIVPAGLIADDISLGNETIRMIHSPLDIGQAKDVFDNNIETLMRGREANPFILDLRFSQPQAIKGLMMDFGHMDFVMQVQVYGVESLKPVSYQGEYRQQPDIPHIDIDFTDGPEQVKRIYIEIEQLNPPDEVHIHIREIVFTK